MLLNLPLILSGLYTLAVGIFQSEAFQQHKNHEVLQFYAGNKRYIPKYREIELKTGKMFSDSIIIECTKE